MAYHERNSAPSHETALHVVRGRFKDYREGGGLGRSHAAGIWWGAPHVRGDEAAGKVEKDYELKVAK